MISVIIINYHCATLTIKSVQSVQNENETTEIFVVDNSVNAEEALQLKHALDDPVYLIINERNTGFAHACNLAYQQCNGEFILLLNPDAYMLKGCLTLLKNALISLPKAGAVGPNVYWDDKQQFFLPPSLFPSPWLSLYHNIWKIHPLLHKLYSLYFRQKVLKIWQSKNNLIVPALSGGHILLLRQAIESCHGLFDENFFMYYEDSDLILRLKKENYHLYQVTQAKCVHHYQHTENKVQLMNDSAHYYFQKHYSQHFLNKINSWLHWKPAKFSTDQFIILPASHYFPHLKIPKKLKYQWLLEISPSPFFIPAIGLLSNNSISYLSNPCLNLSIKPV